MFTPKARNPTSRLRSAVEAMPRFAREAMLRGIDENPIIAGAYADPRIGGVCPMLAAHRNGGRTNLASFARSWDRYTGARRARLVSDRELRTLRSLLEMSLVRDETGGESLSAIAAGIREERKAIARRPAERRIADTGERNRGHELRNRDRWSWILPARSLSVYKRRIAAAEEAMAEARAEEMLDRRVHAVG